MMDTNDPPIVDDEGRVEPPLQADELTTLLGFLDFQRATLAWKCSGLDGDGLRARLGESTMTLGGILKHLAWVEDFWFSRKLQGNSAAPAWEGVDWKAEPDWTWTSAAKDAPEHLFTLWQDAVDRSRALVSAALENSGDQGLATCGQPMGRDTRNPSLRWILVHMIEEYARHNGHADLLRESVDGLTGE